MPTHVLMPALSPEMQFGKLGKWLKREGDRVEAGDILAEIETDMATMEIEAVESGVLERILVLEGAENVPVDTPIALIDTPGRFVRHARQFCLRVSGAVEKMLRDLRAAIGALTPTWT